LYGTLGIVQAPITDGMVPPGVPRGRWLVEALAPLGVSEEAALRGLFLAYLASLAGLLLGWQTRVMALVAWLLHLTLKTGSYLSVYGAYEFAHIGLFYCLWMPVGHALSLDAWTGRVRDETSADARLGLRLLQLHLGIVYFSSGVEKASGVQWWNGEALWRALMRPDFAQFDFSWLADYPWVAMLACWGTLAVEVGYPLFIWPARTRRWMALAAVGLHAGIAVCMGLWSFSALMIVLNVAAFLVPAEPAPDAVAGPAKLPSRAAAG
jgi:hypothetical protein